ncbi:DUF664 domain-containing protein [Paenibacillus nanensis]|uniref:DUF664 domain-containing protein n=1 Tax=Paenibacillus nanensis TaxID=393251 RepID=A0A3A1VL62_9BACL|nr:DinB family protein [Paenibacillus nanensis]RIX60502.1 DUF664 domain-containing protein [Paenibacillus nanensis]
MIKLFHSNWIIREEWFELLKRVPNEELLRNRIGGQGSILNTIFHILDVEYSWICGIQGKPEVQVRFENYNTLEQLKTLSDSWMQEIKLFLETWSDDFENDIVTVPWSEERYTEGEILLHIIAHEIHHMGQLSIWAREMGIQPVSANVIGRGLFVV